MLAHPTAVTWRHYTALLSSFAVVAAGVSAAQLHHNWTAAGVQASFGAILGLKLAEWSAWAVAVPVIIWLDRRQGFAARGLVGGAVVHLLAGIALSLLLNALLSALTPLADPLATQQSFARLYTNRLIFKLPASLGVYALILATYGVVHLMTVRYADLAREARLETELASSRLHNLQMQLQPHFLFNSLHSIGGLIREGESERAVDMIAELSELLRRALATSDRQEVRLEEELSFLEHYVRLQQTRFSDRMRVRFDIDPGARSALIPSFILQPLVENSIRHGLERTGRVVDIGISARVEDGQLMLEVSDTGPGPAAVPVAEGVGLGTTRQRLAHLYGTQHALAIGPRPGGGTLVSLVLPRRVASAG